VAERERFWTIRTLPRSSPTGCRSTISCRRVASLGANAPTAGPLEMTVGMFITSLRDSTVPIDDAVGWADAPEAMVRAAVAAREDMPVPVLERLADDPSESVACSVAGNRATPDAVLERLAGHASS